MEQVQNANCKLKSANFQFAVFSLHFAMPSRPNTPMPSSTPNARLSPNTPLPAFLWLTAHGSLLIAVFKKFLHLPPPLKRFSKRHAINVF